VRGADGIENILDARQLGRGKGLHLDVKREGKSYDLSGLESI